MSYLLNFILAYNNPMQIRYTATEAKQLKVAAYCRVSTDQEEQLSSYEAQIKYYTEKISSNKDWIFAGIYADEGISGTSVEKRPQFLKMIRDCKKGKIDIILTKSLSRFSRNTVDCLEYVRMLKELGIAVIFEKENINTLTAKTEFMITIMSTLSQGESESLSENVKFGIRQSFRSGNFSFKGKRILGYREGADGTPEIVEEEAVIIRRIYQSYIDGMSIAGIAKTLNNEGIKPLTDSGSWSPGGIQYILTNEKYAGDVLLQKSYVSNCLTKKTKKNNGELPKYLISNNHTPIIERELFNKVQEEFARRKSKRKVSQNTLTEQGGYSSEYALSELLRCGDCGSAYRRKIWKQRNGVRRAVWRCINRIENGPKFCKESPSIHEDKLHKAIVGGFKELLNDKDELLSLMQDCLNVTDRSKNDFVSVYSLEARIKEINQSMIDLINLAVKSGEDEVKYESQLLQLKEEKQRLQSILEAEKQKKQNRTKPEYDLKYMLEELSKNNISLEDYDDILVRKLIDTVIVQKDNTIKIYFKGGLETVKEIPED